MPAHPGWDWCCAGHVSCFSSCCSILLLLQMRTAGRRWRPRLRGDRRPAAPRTGAARPAARPAPPPPARRRPQTRPRPAGRLRCDNMIKVFVISRCRQLCRRLNKFFVRFVRGLLSHRVATPVVRAAKRHTRARCQHGLPAGDQTAVVSKHHCGQADVWEPPGASAGLRCQTDKAAAYVSSTSRVSGGSARTTCRAPEWQGAQHCGSATLCVHRSTTGGKLVLDQCDLSRATRSHRVLRVAAGSALVCMFGRQRQSWPQASICKHGPQYGPANTG